MKARTVDQIANMKQQTFGVEVEMNNIKRSAAAKLAAEYFGTRRYADTNADDGYGAWSAWDAQGRKWKFVSDCSIHGPSDEECEMVTPILTYVDMELLQGLCRKLRKAGAKSNAYRGCGVHIHIGADGHTAQTLRNLTNIMASHEALLTQALQLRSDRTDRYCRPVDPRFVREVNAKKPTTLADLADVWYTANGANIGRTQHYNDSRYHMLNLHATFTKGTIEFRLFQFDVYDPEKHNKSGIHAGQLKSWIQLCLALSEMAKMVKKADPKPMQMENPKYAMRTWLLRLGFIGDEFATARDILTRNLEGDAAFRHTARRVA